jgi:pimeloyl-ACP methyl ester carboxylesterase
MKSMNEIQEIGAEEPTRPVADVEECWMEIDGARMRYLRAGSGPALILLHGLMGYAFSWRYVMPALAPYATVYAIDSLGAGFSDRPNGIDHSMRGTALRVLRFAENLKLGSFDLLGTSRGGAVAMSAAAECLERADRSSVRVRRLVLVAPVNPYSAHGKRLAPFFATRFGAAGFRWTTARMPFLFPYFHSRLYARRDKIPAGSLEGYKAPLAIPGLFEHALSIVQTWTADLRELDGLLPRLAAIPTLLMWGDQDPAVYVSSMGPLARHFRHAEAVVFPGVGHLPYEECVPEFNRTLIQFLVRPVPGHRESDGPAFAAQAASSNHNSNA